jgi:hypothetical protein
MLKCLFGVNSYCKKVFEILFEFFERGVAVKPEQLKKNSNLFVRAARFELRRSVHVCGRAVTSTRDESEEASCFLASLHKGELRFSAIAGRGGRLWVGVGAPEAGEASP